MAASRMSRIHRLALLLTVAFAVVAQTLAQSDDSEFGSDTESPLDLKKQSQKKYHKNVKESEWSYKGETKKSDSFKDPKDIRLLRLISEGLLNPQDTLPIVSNDAIISSQINNSSKDISVNVQPEGMSGIVNDGISADSAERTIMEKKKDATAKEKISKFESESSKESDEDIKVNLDANVGVQTPNFNKQKGSISVPAQKQISLSKGKENIHKKEINSYEVLSLKPSKEKPTPTDEGVFDFVDSPLSDKHLVPSGTAQTSRVNVKKGPNGQDYEYEYIYYYYEDEGETPAQNAVPSAKGNEIPVSTGAPTQRTTTPVQRVPSSTPKYAKSFSEDGLGTRVKSSEVLHEEVSLPQPNREKFRYSIDNSNVPSQPVPPVPSKSSFSSNDVFYSPQFNSARFPSRQSPSPSISEQPVLSVTQQSASTTSRPISRGRSHYNPTTEDDSNVFAVTPQSVPVPTREPQARTKPSNRQQQGLELVDSNSFRTHSTNIPSDYEKAYTQFENQPKGKSLKQNYDDSGIAQNQPTSAPVTKSSESYQKDHVIEYADDTSRAPVITTPTRSSFPSSTQVTESLSDNTAPFSTLADNSLTTVYGAGLTDKAAHDLYAIYQTQNEESKSFPEEARTTITDDADINSYFATNVPTTVILSTSTTTTTTTTTTPPPTRTTTTTAAPIASSAVTGRGRFRGNGASRRGFSSTTEQIASASEASHSSESTEKTRSKFQPSNRREPGNRVSAYGRKSTTVAPEHDSSNAATKDQESTRPSFVPSSRTRFRGGNVRSETGSTTENGSIASTTHSRPNLDRYSTSRRNSLSLRRTTTTTAAPGEDDAASNSSAEPQEQSSSTFRSIRNRPTNPNSPVRPLRPGPKLNIPPRNKLGSTSTTSTTPSAPLDADTSGSADVPVEQKHTEETAEHEESVGETVITTQSTTTTTTPVPDALTRLKNRPKYHPEKTIHPKAQPAQQSNSSAVANQNRRQLVNNLLPRKKQAPPPPPPAEEPKEEKHEVSKPVEEVVDESSPKLDSEASETSPVLEVSSTTENRLSILIASRRRNVAARKPGTLANTHNKQTASEES